MSYELVGCCTRFKLMAHSSWRIWGGLVTPRNLAKKIARIAGDKKAIDVAILDLRKLTSFTDFFIICSGSSDRQVTSIAQAIRDDMKKDGRIPLGEEGLSDGQWALIDYGDVVAHVFHDSVRNHYQLERLWYDTPRVDF